MVTGLVQCAAVGQTARRALKAHASHMQACMQLCLPLACTSSSLHRPVVLIFYSSSRLYDDSSSFRCCTVHCFLSRNLRHLFVPSPGDQSTNVSGDRYWPHCLDHKTRRRDQSWACRGLLATHNETRLIVRPSLNFRLHRPLSKSATEREAFFSRL